MNFVSARVLLPAAACLMFALAQPASAQSVALTSARGVGNQSYTGALAMFFNVLSPISVTSLGAFDSGQDGFTNRINVGIFNRDTTTLVSGLSAVLTTGNTVAIGQSRFLNIGSVLLAPGNYAIVAQGFGAADLNGNAGFGGAAPTINTGNGSLQFIGNSYYSPTQGLVYPTVEDFGPANRYDAGTFVFTAAAAAPEPGSIALLLTAGVPVIGLVRRRATSRI